MAGDEAERLFADHVKFEVLRILRQALGGCEACGEGFEWRHQYLDEADREKVAGTLLVEKARLFNGHGLRQVAGLIHVAAAADGDVISQQLQGNDF